MRFSADDDIVSLLVMLEKQVHQGVCDQEDEQVFRS